MTDEVSFSPGGIIINGEAPGRQEPGAETVASVLSNAQRAGDAIDRSQDAGTVEIAVTRGQRLGLEALLATGLFGTTLEEVAERLMSQALREYRGEFWY
jgi:hypothetical protein